VSSGGFRGDQANSATIGRRTDTVTVTVLYSGDAIASDKQVASRGMRGEGKRRKKEKGEE